MPTGAAMLPALAALAERADRLDRAADALEARHADHLTAAARALRDSYVPEARRSYGATALHHEAGARGRHLSSGRDENPYAFNGGNENSWHYRADGSGRKRLDDYRADYVTWCRGEDRDALPLPMAPDAPEGMLADLDLADALRVRADADRRIVDILTTDRDDWRYDDRDRALAETELLEAGARGDALLDRSAASGVTVAGTTPGADALPDDAPTVIGYVRTAAGETEAPTAAEQEATIRGHAGAQGWRVAALYSDHAGGTSIDARPALAAALRSLEAPESPGRPVALLVARLDRLARSASVVGRTLERAAARGWGIVALDLGMDTRAAQGRKVAAGIIEVGSWRRETISSATRAGMARAAAEGRRAGRRPMPAETVALLRAMRAEGISFARMADRLNAERVPTAQGGAWHAKTIRRVLARSEETGGAQDT